MEIGNWTFRESFRLRNSFYVREGFEGSWSIVCHQFRADSSSLSLNLWSISSS
jgi:hypothetical protein